MGMLQQRLLLINCPYFCKLKWNMLTKTAGMLAHLPKGYCIMWAMGSRCSWHQPRTKVWSDRTLLSAFGFLLHPLFSLQFIFKLLVTQEQKWPISSSNKITSDVTQSPSKSALLLAAVPAVTRAGKIFFYSFSARKCLCSDIYVRISHFFRPVSCHLWQQCYCWTT